MSEDKYAVSQRWVDNKDYKTPFDHYLPRSKQMCLVARVDMPDLMKMGIANELDFMTKSLVADEISSNSKEAVVSAVVKSDNFARMEVMINAVCATGILLPKVHAVPEHEAARQKGLLYVDQIPFDDRMELFGILFDAEGLSTFLEEQTVPVGDVADVPDVPLSADGPVSARSEDTEGLLL